MTSPIRIPILRHKSPIIRISLIAITALFVSACSQREEPKALAIGYGADIFKIGDVLYAKSFNQPEDWVIQVEEGDTDKKPSTEFKDGIFDSYMPAAGCTAWLKQKFEGPIAIVYKVKCPTDRVDGVDVQVRDINNFWHASDPIAEENLFDKKLYTGGFGSYHKMHGYYASTGGGGPNQSNFTTRFRRYPRQDYQGNDLEHIALNERDGKEEYLITPDKWHTVQLVAYNGLTQYIVDGKVVYELKEGEPITIGKGSEPLKQGTYTFDKFPVHNSGYVGLRMVRTHHQYKDFTIYRLYPKG
ncbi:DUF6250 domain-containing protein [Pelagicoccus enzymogenes]|uniref:DUF6250 domain-containing protein n=1 Tax=Pelagicoccus enzymogenes TaxID=2773457 RepID=UPI00280C9F31|nr:DUF6250 domain-containing protein [Pelagicoccus enzymogenes]MDQ8197880.1 DUF6250 domain-containing protein [Pelagicoccus enzymogenes]